MNNLRIRKLQNSIFIKQWLYKAKVLFALQECSRLKLSNCWRYISKGKFLYFGVIYRIFGVISYLTFIYEKAL